MEIEELISLRKRAGIVSSSAWADLGREYSGFAGIVMNDKGEEVLAVSIGSNYLGPGEGWSKGFEKIAEYTVWIRDGL